MKPGRLTRLTAGKAIGSPDNRGFVDTFNWLVDFCNNLQGDGNYIEVQNPLGDFPMITFGDQFPFGGVNISGGGGGECSCAMSADFDTGVRLATFDNGTEQTDIYMPDISGDIVSSVVSSVMDAVSCECSCEMSAALSAQTYQDQGYRSNTKIARFKDCHGNTTDVYAPDSVRFQGNVGTKTKTGWTNSFQFETGVSSNVHVICNGSTIQIGAYYI